MNKSHLDDNQNEAPKQDFLEKRGFTWGLLMIVLVLTLVAVLVIGYLMAMHNSPSH
jgi:hypothetical protein